MKRVIVIGCPGSGKSTFSKSLHEATGIPLYHLDMMYWNADRSKVEKPVFLQRLADAMAQDSWIIDGNFGSTMEQRLCACDTVFFLDYPVDICLQGIKGRKGQERSDMPWVENDDNVDEEFITFIKDYTRTSRPAVLDLLAKYPDKNVYIFKQRTDADNYLHDFTKGD